MYILHIYSYLSLAYLDGVRGPTDLCPSSQQPSAAFLAVTVSVIISSLTLSVSLSLLAQVLFNHFLVQLHTCMLHTEALDLSWDHLEHPENLQYSLGMSSASAHTSAFASAATPTASSPSGRAQA